MKAGVLAEPVLVGRERELEELKGCLDLASEGKGATVFVSGEAGSGKSRLITEFLSRARKQGITTLAGWCLSNAAVPYFPFFEAFNAYFSDGQKTKGENAVDITMWLKGPTQNDRFGKFAAFTPQTWKDQTFIAVTRTLLEMSTKKPLILFVEDLQWADSASLALIHYVARAINREKVLLLGTFRSEQLTTDAEGRPHPLAETLQLMKREDLFKEIVLANLNQTSVYELAKDMLDGELQQELADKLAKESQGNPLFIVESLRMLYERGELLQQDEKWRLTREELEIPDKIKDIILHRLNTLLRNQRKIVDAASVIGEKFDAKLLAPVVGLDFAEVVETLDVIGQTTSLLSCEGELYSFDHARSRDAVYGEISPALKRVYHGKVAEQLERMPKNGKSLFGGLAYHYAQAGDEEKAVKYALVAGQDALTRWSNIEAIRHFDYVLQVADAPKSIEAKKIALEGLGDAYYANCMFEKAIEAFEKLAVAATGNLKLRAYRKEMEAIWYKDMDSARLMELVKKAEDYSASDRLENARVRWNRARALFAGKPEEHKASLEDHEEALRVFEEEYSLHDVANLAVGTGVGRGALGLFEEGLSEVLRGTALFHELGDTLMEVHSSNIAVGSGFRIMGLYQEALNTFDYVIQDGKRIGDFHSVSSAFLRKGEIFGFWGNFEEAISQSLKALEYSQKTDSEVAQGRVYSNLVALYACVGDLKRAEEYYSKLMKMPFKVLPMSWGGHFGYVEFAKSVLFIAKGEYKEANQYFEESIEFFKRLPPLLLVGLEMHLRKFYAWGLDRQGRIEEAQFQLAEIQRLTGEVEKRFAHARIQAKLMARRQVTVGEEFELRCDLVNVGRKPALLIRVEGTIPDDFKVIDLPSFCSLQDGGFEMKRKNVGPFQVETVKLKLRATKVGSYSLNPEVTYIDELGKTKASKANPITITAQPIKPAYEALPGRVATGHAELDRLLFGGIPEKYAIVLAAPSSDEREMLINRFCEAGAEAGETTFHITADAVTSKALAEEYPSNFYLFLCNPQADTMVRSAPNVFKLKGIENLTEIDITLTKAFRTLNPSTTGPKRICIEILSDVLLQHHTVTTRRWLSALLPTLKSKGFTTLAVFDPHMHSPEEVQAILGVFDGEIRIAEKETPEGTKQVLKIRKLYKQKYLENEETLTKEKLAEQRQA